MPEERNRWTATSHAQLAEALAPSARRLGRGSSVVERQKVTEEAERRMRASALGLVELCGACVNGQEHTWLQAGGWWADPVGAAIWGIPCAGALPHPLAKRPEWKEAYAPPKTSRMTAEGIRRA